MAGTSVPSTTPSSEVHRLVADPTTPHSDADGLDDGVEVHGWTVPVERRDGEPLRYEPDSEVTMHVIADPMDVDSDDDGAADDVEKRTLHTDPEERVTYLVTERHSAELLRHIKRVFGIRNRETVHWLGLVADRTPSVDRVQALELTDASDDFDFVYRPGPSLVQRRLVYATIGGEPRADTWFSNLEEHRAGTDPWVADGDSDGLTDGQEVKWVVQVDGDSKLDHARRSPLSADTDPSDPDTDGDDALDGGGYEVVNGHELGRILPDNSEYGRLARGETFHFETNPTVADVVEVRVATDAAFREQFDHHRAWLRTLFRLTNQHFREEFENEEAGFYLRIVNFTKWDAPNRRSDGTLRRPKAMRSDLLENQTWLESRGRADLLSGFSGKPMGADFPSGDDILEELKHRFSRTSDGASDNPPQEGVQDAAVVGTHDITINSRIAKAEGWRVHLYQHEVAHALGAQHPTDTDRIPRGTGGVMCKYSCILDPSTVSVIAPLVFSGSIGPAYLYLLNVEKWVFSTHDWSDENHDLLLTRGREVIERDDR